MPPLRPRGLSRIRSALEFDRKERELARLRKDLLLEEEAALRSQKRLALQEELELLGKERQTGLRHILVASRVVDFLDLMVKKCADRQDAAGFLTGTQRENNFEITGFTEYRTWEGELSPCEKAWQLAADVAGYIGGWHTHALGRPEASDLDKAMLIAKAKEARLPRALVVAAPQGWNVYVALFSGFVQKLEVVAQDISGRAFS